MKFPVNIILVCILCGVLVYTAGTPNMFHPVKICDCSAPAPVSTVLVNTQENDLDENHSDENLGFYETFSVGGTTGSSITEYYTSGTAGVDVVEIGGTTSTETLVKIEPIMSTNDELEINSEILMCQ